MIKHTEGILEEYTDLPTLEAHPLKSGPAEVGFLGEVGESYHETPGIHVPIWCI